MFGRTNVWFLLAGLAVFLFGMSLFEDAIKGLAGYKFKEILEKFTRGSFRSVFTGIFTTAILQSSSATSLIVLALVGVGMMSLVTAIGVVLGAAVGTTFGETLIGIVGLKFDLSSVSFPFIAVGGLLRLFFPNNEKITNISKFLLGFGFLFLGLEYMKESVFTLTKIFDFQNFVSYGPWLYFLIGLVFASLMHSSSATAIIVLAGLEGGIITLPLGIAALMGAYIGTTITALIGSIGDNITKKQVAVGYLLFNLIWVGIGFIFFDQIIWFFAVTGLITDPVLAASIFHTCFKFIGVLLFIPILPHFSRLIEYIVRDTKKTQKLLIEQASPDILDLALVALQKDVQTLMKKVVGYHASVFGVDENLILQGNLNSNEILNHTKFISDEALQKYYDDIKQMEDKILTFVIRIKAKELTSQDLEKLKHINFTVVNVAYSCKYLKDVKDFLILMKHNSNEFVKQYYQEFRHNLVRIYERYIKILNQNGNKEEQYNELMEIFKSVKKSDRLFLDTLNLQISEKISTQFYLTSMINTSRYMYLAAKSLIFSIKDFL